MLTATRVFKVISWGASDLWRKIDEIKIIVRKWMARDVESWSLAAAGRVCDSSQNTLEHLFNEIDTWNVARGPRFEGWTKKRSFSIKLYLSSKLS